MPPPTAMPNLAMARLSAHNHTPLAPPADQVSTIEEGVPLRLHAHKARCLCCGSSHLAAGSLDAALSQNIPACGSSQQGAAINAAIRQVAECSESWRAAKPRGGTNW